MLAQGGLGLPNLANVSVVIGKAPKPDKEEEFYNFPIGRTLDSDYGFRKSNELTKRRYILGRR